MRDADNPVDRLIDASYLETSRRATDYVAALSVGILRELGLWNAADLEQPRTAGEWMTALAVVEELGIAFAWLLEEGRRLGALGVAPGGGSQAPAGPLYAPAAPAVAEEIVGGLAALRDRAIGSGSSLEMFDYVASRYVDFLRGQRSGNAILYKGAALEVTCRYYSAANPLYDVHNQLGWLGVEAALARLGRPARLLEVGAGTGGATEAVLRGLAAGAPAAGGSLVVTDISPSFALGTVERLASGGALPIPLEHRKLDFTRPPLEQGVAPGSVDVILAVNALHNAGDPVAALANLRSYLAPDGSLVVSESICDPGAHVHQEFVFNLLPYAPRGRFRAEPPTSRFLSAAAWGEILGEAGYGGEVRRNGEGPQLALLAIARPGGL